MRPAGATRSMQAHWSTAIHRDGYLYGSSGRHDTNAELRCIELATGKVLWSEPDSDAARRCFTSTAISFRWANAARCDWSRSRPSNTSEVAETLLVDEVGHFGPAPLLKFPAWAPPVSVARVALRPRRRATGLRGADSAGQGHALRSILP